MLDGWLAYTWVFLYLVLICFNMSYGKHLISDVHMLHPIWGSVLYTNLLSIPPTMMLGWMGKENPAAFLGMTPDFTWSVPTILVLFTSGVIGVGIAFTGFACRKALSAAAYTLVGVVNKLMTVLLNVFLFDDHASVLGVAALCVTIAGATLYEQSPMRSEYSRLQQQDVTLEEVQDPNVGRRVTPSEASCGVTDLGGTDTLGSLLSCCRVDGIADIDCSICLSKYWHNHV